MYEYTKRLSSIQYIFYILRIELFIEFCEAEQCLRRYLYVEQTRVQGCFPRWYSGRGRGQRRRGKDANRKGEIRHRRSELLP